MNKAKSYKISKTVVKQAYEQVKKNKGAAGIDKQSIEEFEENLKDNLYKIWNRMSSGSYFPPPVKAVEIPKKTGGTRRLGIPTVADRIAQMVVKIYFEPMVEPYFKEDSYGYRTGKSALEAIEVTRKRCWKYDWVLEYDIKGLFDTIDHELLIKAVEKHTECRWIKMYIERWLKTPFQTEEGEELTERKAGTPQGGVISPVLANLFLHYAVDKWMERNHPANLWARYADDGIVHCKSRAEAENLLLKLKQRFAECGLELHPDKTRIIYCKDDNRTGNQKDISFDFLGYTFQPRQAKGKNGERFLNFLPALSNQARKIMYQRMRYWKKCWKSDWKIADIAEKVNLVIRGWFNYYGRFYKSAMYTIFRELNWKLSKWIARKYKRVAGRSRQAQNMLAKIAKQNPQLFVHWELGHIPTIR